MMWNSKNDESTKDERGMTMLAMCRVEHYRAFRTLAEFGPTGTCSQILDNRAMVAHSRIPSSHFR